MSETRKTEHPILFKTEMMQALAAGRKTQTRRLAKNLWVMEDFPDGWKVHGIEWMQDWTGKWGLCAKCSSWGSPKHKILCPYNIGDTLWVRETHYLCWPEWSDNGMVEQSNPWMFRELAPQECDVIYRAETPDFITTRYDEKTEREYGGPPPWRPGIHMWRWASRVELTITGIRFERVQDITEEDARAEGVVDWCHNSFVDSFQLLWEQIHAKDGKSWGFNPWVWVIEFSCPPKEEWHPYHGEPLTLTENEAKEMGLV
jgi:hypothetical protein